MDHREALHQYIEATNTHEFSNVEKILHHQALFWFTNQTYSSKNEIQRYFEKAWDMIKEEVYRANDVEWLTVDKNSATCIYTYHYEGYHNGEFISGGGRATNVFCKNEEGEWKLIHEHLSSI
ncbi:nuclear transport factor 2 family protein [Bacillus sp. CECT 9360]|uniref:YybH family protein n=1 Tax=Bacillus sp. CECT 9360 TaxID=2845821 RepID=UPI001E5BF30F|nr:nuclear transport factor 2 family protein [Bacillus sp. CECT 9360]CAH0344261.1 hypothetical protein BCI9360_00504 [Bacillus sp. CECT 9360]